MEINKHINFLVQDQAELLAYFEQNNITFDKYLDIITLDIYESNEHWPTIEQYVKRSEKQGGRKITVLSNTIFSKQELDSAEYFFVRSIWRNGYPQPLDDNKYKKGITYSDDNACSKCGLDLKQIDSFRLEKRPKWGRRHFYMLNWVPDEFFVDEVAKNMLEKSGLSGFSFRSAKNRSGKEVFDNVWQLNIPTVLPKGIITENSTAIRQIWVCPECGKPKYTGSGIGMYKYKKETFNNAPDFSRTYEHFGWGYGMCQNIVINNKVYKFLTENQLDKCLEFRPIELV